MSSNDTDFSASAELALRIPESEKRRVESEVSDIGPVMLSAGGQGASQSRAGEGVQQSPAQLTELETVTDLAEEQLRVDELRNDLLRELLEDTGAGLAGAGGSGGGGGGGGGAGGVIPGAGLLARGGSLLAGGVSAAGAGLAGAGALAAGAIGFSLTQDPREDARVPTNDQGEADLFANTPELRPSNQIEGLLDGVDINKPDWLGSDGTIDVRQDLVEDTTATSGETPEGSPGGSSAPTSDVGGPTGTGREDLVEDTLAEGQTPSGSRDGGSPGGSSPPVSDIGGPGRNTSTGAGLVEAVLGDVGSTPDGSPGGSTPSRTGRRNEAAERRRQDAPTINAEARVEGDGISEREAERIAEEKATEAAEEIRNEIQRSRR